MLAGYLSWGAWESAHDPARFFAQPGWLHGWLRPGDNWVLLILAVLGAASFVCYWLPRRRRPQDVGLNVVVALVLIGAVLGIASQGQCRNGQAPLAVTSWLLQLYVGQLEPLYPTGSCPAHALPLALQLGRTLCLGATFLGAIAATAVVWRAPAGRLRARLVRDVVVLTGLDAMTLPMLQELTRAGRSSNVLVIEADQDHPRLAEAREAGARIMIGDPASVRVLRPVIEGWRGCALSRLYALHEEPQDNEAVLAAAREVLVQYDHGDRARQPHLVARIDDPRHADFWRGRHSETAGQWFEDALSPPESTAAQLVNEVAGRSTRQLLLCGDTTLALAVLLELAHRTWERKAIIAAEKAGRAEAGASHVGLPPVEPPPAQPVERVVLLDDRAEDLRREFLDTCPKSIAEALPDIAVEVGPWQAGLLARLDTMTAATAAETAVIVTQRLADGTMHEAGRAARLHPRTEVLVLTTDGAGIGEVVHDHLRPFHRSFLVDQGVPEDTWTRIARHWHECWRRAHPAAPGDPRAAARRSWAELDGFVREDNILQIRSVLAEVAARGRQWVPVRGVIPGSHVELSEEDVMTVAEREHGRWYARRWAAGWRADERSAVDPSLVNAAVVPWEEFPAHRRAENAEFVRHQVAELEDAGFMPVLTRGGPPDAEDYVRTGWVLAVQLTARRRWTPHTGDDLYGDAGDWRVTDECGDERTVRDAEFQASHEPLGNDQWRRTGINRAWRVTSRVRLRTIEGNATAQAGDWIVEDPSGVRWPVSDEAFRRGYGPSPAQP